MFGHTLDAKEGRRVFAGEDAVDDPFASGLEEDDWQSCIAEDEEDKTLPVPHKESDTVTVWKHRDLPDVKYCRVSQEKRPGRQKKAVYCYVHGCSKMRKPELFREDHSIAAWVKAGNEYPERNATNKRRHEREFDSMWPAPKPK